MSSSAPSGLEPPNPPASYPNPSHNAYSITQYAGAHLNPFLNIASNPSLASYQSLPPQFNNFAMGGMTFYPSAPCSVGMLRQPLSQVLPLAVAASTHRPSVGIGQNSSPPPNITSTVANVLDPPFESSNTEYIGPEVVSLVSRSNNASLSQSFDNVSVPAAVSGEDGYVGCADENAMDDKEDNSTPPFWKGQRFATVDIFDAKVMNYAVSQKFEMRREISKKPRSNANFDATYTKYFCARARKRSRKRQKTGKKEERPNRTSLKCDCKFFITVTNPMKDDLSGRHECVEICGLSLIHTNGCKGSDELINECIRNRAGRKYSSMALGFLKKEVKSGRYTTDDVLSWLNEQGVVDATLHEATNLRYRLIKDRPIKDWNVNKVPEQEMGEMKDFLFNTDLAAELSAGGQGSVDNLRIVHRGLRSEVKGYDSRTTTDSENRFSGTAWQTGRMRARCRTKGVLHFLDDSRSGISTSGFCFWNFVIVDQDGKVEMTMGGMTMSPSNDAVRWLCSSLVSMCPEAADVVEAIMSDMGVKEEPVSTILPNVTFFGGCTWHMMTVDFPRNLSHITEYERVKTFVYDNLVHNTVSKAAWEIYLMDACRQWPEAASYLQVIARNKHRWGSPWRLSNFTMGYEASSPVEGSFSAFQRALGNTPRSFVGVVQEHVKKDIQKTSEERRRVINLQIRSQDVELNAQRSDAANECAKSYSHHVTDKFEVVNQSAQNYTCEVMEVLPDEQISYGVSVAHLVKRRNISNVNDPPSPRVVEEIGGIKYCSCLEDRNCGYPCRHIQCVLGGAFSKDQFHKHWELAVDVPEDDAVNEVTSSTTLDFNASIIDDGVGVGDGVGVFVSEYASISVSSQIDTEVRRPVSRVKRLDSTAKYNHILAEAKEIASIASAERNSCFEKVRNVLKWLRNNIQQNV
ncbi:hypothetical protein ACHAXR_004536, partial [Thalassiosira sp. AJA248-18]